MNFTQAKKIFVDYLKQYDTSDDKIRLKIVHTYGVVQAASYIASGLPLSQTDVSLAAHIALLHDIGRFEQLKRYHSFDDAIIPHAELSLKILFEDHLIEEFLPERDYDSVIYTAIKNHGLYLMDQTLTAQNLLQSRIIRDADKLDNFRVKVSDSVETMLDVTVHALGEESISDHIYETFLSGTPIRNSDRKTHMDMWVSYLGYIFDLNFPVSRQYVIEHDYVNQLIDRIPYTNPQTFKRMGIIRTAALDFLTQ